MNVSVTRLNVARIVTMELDGRDVLVTEGIDFVCSCGCLVTFGIRLDTNDKTMNAVTCPYHRATWPRLAHEFLDDHTTDTDVLLKRLLSA